MRGNRKEKPPQRESTPRRLTLVKNLLNTLVHKKNNIAMVEPGNFFNHPVYICTSDITHFLHSAHASASKPDHKLMQRNACKKIP